VLRLELGHSVGDRDRAEASAKEQWRSNPFKPFDRVVDDVTQALRGVRVKKPVERSPAKPQADWFEIGSAVMAARAEMLRANRIRGLVDELRALTGRERGRR
jgi:hypothetical protein